MLKALLKKQFLELAAMYFQDRKTGKLRAKKSLVGFAILLGFALLCVAFAFFGMSVALCESLAEAGLSWLFFAILGMISILLGTFGSVFNTYATMYKAKDNDLLLSMPIPSAYVLAARLLGTYSTSLLYSALAWVPALIAYWVFAAPTAASVVFGVLLTFVNALFVSVLTCILGWVVAVISARIKSKSIITVIISLAFIALYYFLYFRMNTFLTGIVANSEAISAGIRTWAYPLYQLGRAASGEVLPMVFTVVLTLAVSVVCGYVMSRSFLRLVTVNKGEKKAVYKETAIRTRSVGDALYDRELKRFLASPTYMLNCGLGLVLLPVLTVFAIIKLDALRGAMDMLAAEAPMFTGAVPGILAAVMCLLISMNAISAPSVSLEGKNIWVVRTMPVEPWEVLKAKLRLHTVMNIVPVEVCTAVLTILLGCKPFMMLCTLLLTAAYVFFSAAFGLALNLKKPNLIWTNEAVPIKQSGAVMIYLFGGWIIAIIMGLVCFFTSAFLRVEVTLLVLTAILCLAMWLLRRRLRGRGARIFAEL